MSIHITVHMVKAVAATAMSHGISHWVRMTISDGGPSYENTEITMFFPTRDIADAYANAINYANASTAVQTNHDRRLSDAGLQEYRAMRDEVA